MLRLSNVLLFTSLHKCFDDNLFSSENVTWIFCGYIGVGTLLVDLFEWSSSIGFYVAQRKKDKKRLIVWIIDDKLIFKKIT